MTKRKTLVFVSGYFRPLHEGHLDYLREARSLGDRLCVIVNNDKQVKIKGCEQFMDEHAVVNIISELRCVNFVIRSIDTDKTVCKTLNKICGLFKKKYANIDVIFAKGGDRTLDNIPEVDVCQKNNIKMVFGVGGTDKKNSSSTMLRIMKKNKKVNKS